MAFVSCNSCQRFVAPSDSVCPFCQAAVTHPRSAGTRSTGARVARSAMLAAAIAAAPACSTSTDPNDAGPVADAGAVDAAAIDAGSDTDAGPDLDSGTSVDAGEFDAGMPLPPYGIPPVDAGPTDDAEMPPAPLYGGSPAIDAG